MKIIYKHFNFCHFRALVYAILDRLHSFFLRILLLSFYICCSYYYTTTDISNYLPVAPGTVAPPIPGGPGGPVNPRSPLNPGAPVQPTPPVWPGTPGIPGAPGAPDAPGPPGKPATPEIPQLFISLLTQQAQHTNIARHCLKKTLCNNITYGEP